MEGYPSHLAVRYTGVPYDRLDYWARTKFLVPSLRPAHGKGSDRLYSFCDLVAIRVARELRAEGISLQRLRRVIDYLREVQGLEQPLAQARLVVAGGDIFLVCGEEELVSTLRRPGQSAFAWVFDIERVVTELQTAIAEAA